MNREDATKWLECQNLGIQPTRIKLAAVVYANHSITEPTHFTLRGREVTLRPLPEGPPHPKINHVEGLMPAFICEVVSEATFHRGGNNFDLQDCLEQILPLTGVRFRLSIHFNQWEEYSGIWIAAPAGGGEARIQSRTKNLPNSNIKKVVEAYEAIAERSDARAKKASTMRHRLKEALELEEVSPRFSFLSYYSIIEIISDDLAKHCHVDNSDTASMDIARFQLSTKGSQRTKIYFLLRAVKNQFDLDRCISLSDTRNDLAHGERSVTHDDLQLCKRIAFWASEYFVLQLSGTTI